MGKYCKMGQGLQTAVVSFLPYTALAHSLSEEQNGRKQQRQKCGYPRLGLMSNLEHELFL